MNAKLFLTTFLLIFLAELGDKTQLAVMARAATGEGARWTVFFGASSALVISTLLAVLVGGMITRVVPESTIKIAAGIGFLLMGAFILREALAKPTAAPAGVSALAKPGVLPQLAMKAAAEFEAAAADDYRRLAEREEHPALRALLQSLAEEERGHMERLRSISNTKEGFATQSLEWKEMPAQSTLSHDVAGDRRPVLAHAIEHEKATAAFYAELARVAVIPSLRSTFNTLAEEERQHAHRLEAMRETEINT